MAQSNTTTTRPVNEEAPTTGIGSVLADALVFYVANRDRNRNQENHDSSSSTSESTSSDEDEDAGSAPRKGKGKTKDEGPRHRPIQVVKIRTLDGYKIIAIVDTQHTGFKFEFQPQGKIGNQTKIGDVTFRNDGIVFETTSTSFFMRIKPVVMRKFFRDVNLA